MNMAEEEEVDMEAVMCAPGNVGEFIEENVTYRFPWGTYKTFKTF